jgi:carbon-monoxide dehydrogenase small subunit
MKPVTLTVNGEPVHAFVEPRTHLADFLREQQRLTGTHLGCEHGVCGACTVLRDGDPVRACITYAVACEGSDIRTIEGFEDDELMARLRAAFSREHGLQCGFCTPGMLIAARDICLRKPHADEREIRVELSGNLCRCTGYVGIVNAIKSVLAERRDGIAMPETAQASARAAEFTTFSPMQAPATAPREQAVEHRPLAADGGTRIDETVAVAAPAAAVWRVLGDIPTAASCLPGAEVLESDGHTVKGRVQVKFGPMIAAFSGAASYERNDSDMTGTVRGAGVDGLSKTRARGELVYRVVPVEDGAAARIEVGLNYTLAGPLAQFSRSGLIQDFAHRLMIDFARNLKDRIARPEAPVREAELRVGALMLSVAWRRFKRLFGRRD